MVCDRQLGCVLMLDFYVTCVMIRFIRVQDKVNLDYIQFPQAVCIMTSGNMVVSQLNHIINMPHKDTLNKTHNPTVAVFNMSGKLLHKCAAYLQKPVSVATDALDNIYVSDQDLHCVIKFSQFGQLLCHWSIEGELSGLTVHGSMIMMAKWWLGVEPSEVLCVCDLDGYNSRCVSSIKGGTYPHFGVPKAVATHHNLVVLLGCEGMIMYKMVPTLNNTIKKQQKHLKI